MLRTVNLVARAAGFAWLGVLAFVVAPPKSPAAMAVQIAGYSVVGAALLVWTLLGPPPVAERYRAWLFPAVLSAMAVGAGSAAGAGGGGSSVAVFGFVAAMSAGSETTLAASLAITLAGILAIEVSGLAFGASYGILLGLPAIVVSGLLIGRNRGAYRIQAEQSAALLAQRDQLESEQRRADLLDERARIAREIHDVLAHSLGALGIQIQAARAVLTDRGDIRGTDEMLATAQRMAAEGLEETRLAVHALRADLMPLDKELARATETHARRFGVPATFVTGGVPVPLPPEATVTLLRVVQESLVNAAKHAAGQPVAVRLDYSEPVVRLSIRNALPPGAADGGEYAGVQTVNGGYGLTGMQERLRLLDGTLEAGRREHAWMVTAQLPRSRPIVMS
ncbi:MAG TPA: histidine kinase [Streptosporangiaceae bacterium]|nr:histidine kinase [Streptosporangiaceae bacterium]